MKLTVGNFSAAFAIWFAPEPSRYCPREPSCRPPDRERGADHSGQSPRTPGSSLCCPGTASRWRNCQSSRNTRRGLPLRLCGYGNLFFSIEFQSFLRTAGFRRKTAPGFIYNNTLYHKIRFLSIYRIDKHARRSRWAENYIFFTRNVEKHLEKYARVVYNIGVE